ncbi:MAG: trigger factor [Planctomycetes bacterium]|nr:trigger factor [Planctomycetota bacterium]
MADEIDTQAGTAVAEAPAEQVEKLDQSVEISDVGPCKKHIKVIIQRQAIDDRFDDKYTELVRSDTSQVNGFRPGKAPRKIIERRFKSSVEEQVRTEVLMASLEQLATENQISPLSAPDLDPSKLEIPDEGPFTYEFDVEVRPEFDLPAYKGLTLKRPVKTFTPADIKKERHRLLEPAGILVPKEGDDVRVDLDDYIVADVEIKDGDTVLNNLKEIRIKVEKQLALSDGLAEKFGKTLAGAKVGEERDVEIKLSESITSEAMRGKAINARFKINDIKVIRLPEMTPALLQEFGVRNEDQFEEVLEAVLNRRLEYIQRQSYRQQILSTIGDASKWDLPQDLLVRQSKKALQKRVMEMRSGGMTDEQIVGRRKVLEQDVIQSTALALREHFVLQKIAEVEKIEISEADIDEEIELIAARSDESPRKVRARLEKEDYIEALATELLERRALDLVLQNAVYEDVELKTEDEEGEVATMSEEAMPGSSDEAPQG